MKPFEEFWSSITEDEFDTFANIASARANSINTDDVDPDKILGTKLSIQNTMMTMQLLNRYHEWLSAQIEK